jgi:hypothetical protein
VKAIPTNGALAAVWGPIKSSAMPPIMIYSRQNLISDFAMYKIAYFFLYWRF